MTTLNTALRTALTTAIVAGAIAAQASTASAVSLSVKIACTSDYLNYCSQHKPGSSATKSCMRRNGSKLSKRCVKALIGAGYVSKAEVARRSAKR
jgi:hypothetical protein